VRASRWPDWLLLEIRHASRALFRRPGFAAAAVLTLALGIGAGTAIFSVVYGVLIRELPYRDAEQLVLVQVRVRATGEVFPYGFSASDLDEWRQRSRVIQSLALCERDLVALDSSSGFETVEGAHVSGKFFAVLGVRTALGRLPGDPVAREIVISDGLWRRRFQSDLSVVGRQVRLDSGVHTIVGVFGPSVTFPVETRSRIGAPADPPDLWIPVDASERWSPDSPRGQIVARVAPGLTFEKARTDLRATARAFTASHPDWAESYEAVLLSLPGDLTGPLRPALWLLLGAVGCVLLVACTNVANLLLARQTARGREVALRISLGAPRCCLSRYSADGLSRSFLMA
jgi:putative ABC transport system permease protein